MINEIVNSQFILFSLFAILAVAIIWHVFETRWDARIFDKDRKGIFKNLHAKAALYAFDHVDGLVPVDVRSRGEFSESHIPGAVNATWSQTGLESSALDSLERGTPVLLYCEGGFASRCAIDSLKELGFHTIYHLHRGFKSWQFFGGEFEGQADTKK